MTTTNDTEFDFEAVHIRKGDRHHFLVPELGISGSGPDLDTAYAALMDKYQAVRREFSDVGALDKLPRPDRSKAQDNRTIRQFGLKAAVITASVCLVLFFGVVAFNSVSNQAIVTAHSIAQKLSVRPLLRSIRKEIVKIGQGDPERREEVFREIRQFVSALKPILDELRPLFLPSGSSPFPAGADAPASERNR